MIKSLPIRCEWVSEMLFPTWPSSCDYDVEFYMHIIIKAGLACTFFLTWTECTIFNTADPWQHHYVSSNDTSACYHHPASLTDTSACYSIIILWLWSWVRVAHRHAIIIWLWRWTCTSPLKHGWHTRSLTRLSCTLFNTAYPLQHH